MASFRGRLGIAVLVTLALLAVPAFGVGALTADETSDADRMGATGGAADATGSAASPGTLGPPNWPAAPLDPVDVPGRHEVENTSEYPHSTVGHLGASGALVSDYHVLTAAHVVTHDNGTPMDRDELTFTPGLRVVPEGPTDAPFGRAEIEEIHVHPDWDGSPPDDDLALLVLDRPVGEIAGSMALPESAVTDLHSRELEQAGYVNNVTGNRQISSTPVPQSSAVGSDDGYHYYCGPLSHGDSGSPIWTDVDGTPTIVSVNSAFDGSADCDDSAVGVRMDPRRTERVRNWMAQTERPAAKADLAIASEAHGIPWVDGKDVLPPGPVNDTDASLPFQTTVYNNGPAAVGASADGAAASSGAAGSPGSSDAEGATVEFLGVSERPAGANGSETDTVVETLCTDEVAVGAYDAAPATCVADGLPEGLADAESVDVYVRLDAHDRVAEYERSPVAGWKGPRRIGSLSVNASAAS